MKILEIIGGIGDLTQNRNFVNSWSNNCNIIAYITLLKVVLIGILIFAALALLLLVKQGKSFKQFLFCGCCNKGESNDSCEI